MTETAELHADALSVWLSFR